METYMPYPDFRQSLEVLSFNDLATARLSAVRILAAIQQTPGTNADAYVEHPVKMMWEGHELQLVNYALLAFEINTTKYQRKHEQATSNLLNWHFENATSGEYSLDLPPWMGNMDFHESQQATLLRGNPEFYYGVFDVPMFTAPVWPLSA